MNSDQMIRMMMRMFRPFINRGITKGIDYAARRGKSPEQMTQEERKQAQQGKAMAKHARKAMRMGRRIGR